MSHFGVLCPPVTGHVNPLGALGRELIRRGHRVTLLHVPDMEPRARAQGLEFAALGGVDHPAGRLSETVRKLSGLHGMAALRFSVEWSSRIAELILRDGPAICERQRIDALLVDQNEPAGGTLAEHLKLPFLSACTSLPLNREPAIPPPFVGWGFSRSPFAVVRNRIGYALADRLIAPIQAVLNTYRKAWNLPLVTAPDDTFSRLATVAQLPREFDFPRDRLPASFHYVGPWFDSWSDHAPAGGADFLFEKLDGRPVVYGSLGTLQSSDHKLFEMMAEACSGLDVQLVISLGQTGGCIPRLPGDPLVMNYVPQTQLLSRTSLTITHAGMNTTLQSLHFGVPAIALPLDHDQPAIAARLARSGAGIAIPPAHLTVARLRAAVEAVGARDSAYRLQARGLQAAIARSGGAARAADFAEEL